METWNEKSEMVRKGPRREKQFSMRPTERVSESHKWLSPGWQAYGRRKKNINNIQQHHFLWKVLNGHFCDHGPTTFQELLTQQSDVQGSFKDHILDPRQGGQGGTIFHRWNWSTLRIHHGQRLQVHNPKWNPAPAVALQHTWNVFLFMYWSGTILGSLNLNLSTRPVKNMGTKWPTTSHLCQGADNDVWPVGRWWHRKPPSSWDFPCKPLREASLSKLSSRMIRPKMDRLSSWELWKSASQKGVLVLGDRSI